ncbi:MAG TPA: putative zinc-binding metallopeptidase [Rhodopila sp.]|nr:putative zinc-binding metallopeptidase [Rhodopila sp.]
MKLFKCQSCGHLLYFENTRCESCGHELGYLPEGMTLSALEPDGDVFRPLAAPERAMRYCDNAQYGACNWMVHADGADTLCLACRHNHTIPDLSVPLNLEHWQRLELAKHTLFYALLRLGLPLANRIDDPEHGLAFDFLADTPDADAAGGATPKVMTGHDNGLITIALAEADDAERERRRTEMHEPYRSLLGHFRHEVGHYFWDVLIRDGGRLDDCRTVFGDDSLDYAAALQAYYQDGPPADWQDHYISRYASMHPWEDWAETWAHYLHIVDTLEMARAFGIKIQPRISGDETLSAVIELDPYNTAAITDIMGAWLPLTFAMNSLNRAMGNPDLYPFVLSPAVVAKLGFVHEVVRRHAGDAMRGNAGDAMRGNAGDAVRGHAGDVVRGNAGDAVRENAGDAVPERPAERASTGG